MKKLRLTIIYVLCLICFLHSFAQPATVIDSLLKRLDNTKDTAKVNVLNNLCWVLRTSQPAKAMEYGMQALKQATTLNFKGGLVRANSRVGVLYMDQGNYPLAKVYFQKALVISEETKNLPGLASTYMNFGNINFYQNDWPQAVENFSKASKVYEQLKDSIGICNCMNNVSNIYFSQGNFTKALEYQFVVLNINRKSNNREMEGSCLDNIGAIYSNQGDLPRSLQSHLAALKIMDSLQNKKATASIYSNVGGVYSDMHNYDEALSYYAKALALDEQLNNKKEKMINLGNIGIVYRSLNKLDLSMEYYKKDLAIAQELNDIVEIASAWTGIGSILADQNKMAEALDYYKKALEVQRKMQNREQVLTILRHLAYVYGKTGHLDESLKVSLESVAIAKETGSLTSLRESKFELSSVYKAQKNYEKALQYYEEATVLKDSVFNQTKAREIGRLESGYELDKKDQQITLLNKDKIIETTKAKEQAVVRNALIAGLALILILAFVLVRSNRHKQHTNIVLTKQKGEIDSKRDSLEKALQHLKSTQSQLIQSEKMASLGELTAGIAHEIQNPLNFVNNFSEVSGELLDEMKAELDKGDTVEAKAIADDIKQNLEKINHHGKRADAIVKGMLQHSSASSGQKELTDINGLCEKYLRLSYHGLQAKDKSFRAELNTVFDDKVGTMHIVPQEIGRVILNLLNNAFYAVNEKKKISGEDYKPAVTIATKKLDGNIQIKVEDNGSGIPQHMIDKIFQPFFTTKPTGQGTGLGLSLAYDIVKAHHGTIDVENNSGGGSRFIIQLPVINS